MKTSSSLWVYGLTGAGLAGAIIGGALWVYPLNGGNLAGHVLTWAMAGIVGIKLYMEGVEATEESRLDGFLGVAIPTAGARSDRREAAGNHANRFEQLEEQRVVAHPRVAPAAAERSECLKFAAQNPICTLATLDEEGEKPHVRTIFLWRADESGFYFVLFSTKRVSRQVKAHPQVELCFRNNPGDLGEARQMRISGKLEGLQNDRMQQQAAADDTLWKNLSGDSPRNTFELYRLSNYEVEFWEMDRLNRERGSDRFSELDSARPATHPHPRNLKVAPLG